MIDLVPSTPAIIFPYTAAELHDHLRVVDDGENDLILDMIKSATQYIEQILERSLLTQTWRLNLHDFPIHITLRRPPIQSVVSVKYYDADNVLQTMIAETDYMVYASENKGYVYLPKNRTWSVVYNRPDAVQVEYLAGWISADLIPFNIMSVLRMIVGSQFANRESFINGTISQELAGRFVLGLLDRYRTF